MQFKDYYLTMGLDKTATQDEIKRAYRKLARKYHPDVSKEAGAELKFKEVGEAYEVLKDPEKRAAYDKLGANWQSGQDFNPPPDWDAGFEFSGGGFRSNDTSAFSDFFESLFGRAGASSFHSRSTFGEHQRRHGYRNRGEDHHAKILIDLEDTFKGNTLTLTLNSPQLDRQGQLINQPHNLKVKIPKGICKGQKIRLAGQGASGTGGGNKGDLYLEVEFKPHPFYQVEGSDIYLQLPVAPWEAALGCIIKVPTPAGLIDLAIPSGSKTGQKLRIKGRGIPAKTVGDFYAVLQVQLPLAESEKAKAVYRKMAKELAFNPRAKLGV